MDPGPLRFRDIFLFQIGHAESIRRVVASRWSLVVGALLVFTAAIARNYDQHYLPWYGGQRIGAPFLAATISSFLVYGAVYTTRGAGRRKPPGFWRQYPGFLGAFLMTAPVAWVYAIPIEVMTDGDRLASARFNVFLLILVSLWRVWLISRVTRVITGLPFFVLLITILIPASAEALIGSFFSGFNLAGAMGGILPPDRQFMVDALEIILIGSFWVLIISVIGSLAIAIDRHRNGGRRWTGDFAGSWGVPPKKILILSAAVVLTWTVIAVPWQWKLWNQINLRLFVHDKDFDGALEFLHSKRRSDFPPGRAFYRDPRRARPEQIAAMLNRLDPEKPDWIMEEYLEAADALLFLNITMNRAQYHDLDRNLITAMARFPEGNRRLQESTARVFEGHRDLRRTMASEDLTRFLLDLDRAGVAIPEEFRPLINPPPPPAAEGDDRGTNPAN